MPLLDSSADPTAGSLLSAAPSAGLLGAGIDPASYGLAQAAAAMGAASAPSRLPISMGQVFGAGAGAMAQGQLLAARALSGMNLQKAQTELTNAQTGNVGLEGKLLQAKTGMMSKLVDLYGNLYQGAPAGGISSGADQGAGAPTSGTSGSGASASGGPSLVSNTTADPMMPREARAFLDSIAGPESGGDYSVLYGGAHATDLSQFPQWSGGQGDQGTTHAAGRYQFEPATWNAIAPQLGITNFSPMSQDRAAWGLAQQVYQQQTGRDLLPDLRAGNTHQIVTALSGTWPTIGRGMGSYAANLSRYSKGGAATGGAAGTQSADGSVTLPNMPDTSLAGAGTGDAALGWAKRDAAFGGLADTSLAQPQIAGLPTTLTPEAPNATSGTGSRGFTVSEGDSIGLGLKNQGMLRGNPVGGRNPQAVLQNITANLQTNPDYYRGQNVILSPGVMNGAGMPNNGIDLVPQQISAIRAAGGNVVLAGADQGRFAGYNPQLAQIAQAAGVPFAGPLPTNDIHPSPAGYRQYLQNAQGMLGAGANAAAGAPQAQPASAAPSAVPVTAPPTQQPNRAAGGLRINPIAAQQIAGLSKSLGIDVPSYIDNAANMAPGGTLSPEYAASQAAAKAQGTLPSQEALARYNKGLEVAGAGPIAAAQAPYKLQSGRPGTQIYDGTGRVVGATPQLERVVTPTTGAESYQYFTPPGAPEAPGASGAPGGISTGTGSVADLGPGQREALVARAKEEQEDRQETIEGAAAAQQQQATLQSMTNEMGSFAQGPFAGHTQEAARYLRLIDPSFNGQVASYEDFVKNAGALTRAAVHETSPRASQQEFSMINETLPNPDMSPSGLARVMNELMGLNDYKIAKAQAQSSWEQAHGGIGNVSGFETDFQKNVSPYAFIMARMDPNDRRGMIMKLQGSADGRQQLAGIAQQLQYIKSSGLAGALQ